MEFPVRKTLTGAISPILLMNWIFGIGVVEYPAGKRRPIISGFLTLVNFVIYLSFLRIANYSEVAKVQGSKMIASNYRTAAYVSAVFIATSMCFAKFRMKIVESILPKINVMNDRLNILGIPRDYDLLFKTQIIHLGIVFASMTVLFALDVKYIGSDFPTEISRIGFIMSFHYFLAFFFVADYTFCVKIRYFRNRFERLNALLEDLDSPERSQTTLAQWSNNQSPRYPSVMDEINRINSQAIRAAEQRWLLHVIKETRKIHRGFCKTAMETNRAYGIQVLSSVALSFGLLIALLYTSYMIVVASFSGISLLHNWVRKTIVLIWLTFYIVKVILIVDACETTSCEANRTGGLIGKLLDAADSDEDIRDEVNIFSLQLIQNPLNFTACGFFPLNYSLIRGMIGSVTTYLVIMIQMRTIYEPDSANFVPNSTMLVPKNDKL